MTELLPALWSKNGGQPQPLPTEDVTVEGYILTNLHASAEARELLGYVPVSCPPKISRMQAQLELQDRGLYDLVNDQIAASGDTNLKIYWSSASDFERTHEQVLAFADILGLDEAAADAFFISAFQRR